jgi:hypothetical protein
MPERVGGSDKAIAADVESAETFAESDVTLSHTRTVVNSESLALGDDVYLKGVDTGTDNTQDTGVGVYAGAVINPNRDLNGLRVTISGNTGTINRVSILRLSDNTEIEFRSVNVTSGDTVALTATLTAGSEYAVRADGGGSDTYTMGYDTDTGSPIAGDELDVTDGWFDGSKTNYNYNLTLIEGRGPATSGSVTVEWPYPPDVYGWDTVLYKRTLDDETVDVYVEEDQSGGWTDVAGPVARGDAIPADPSNNVRYRIEFSRADTANRPTLDAIYRRRKL